MSWKDTIVSEASASSSWKDTIKDDEEQQSVSQVESGIRGLAQGASLGFSDEITGGLEALYDIATTDKELSDIDELYKQRRDESREAYRKAQEANPKTYMAGEVGGAIGTALVPGGALLNASKGARLATTLGKAGLAGGISGAGLSESDNIEDLASDTLKGAAFGVGTAGLMKGGAKALQSNTTKAVGKNAKKAGHFLSKKVYGLLTALTDDQMDTIIKNPMGVKNALSPEGLSQKAKEGVDKLQEFISQADSDAWSTLSSSKAMQKGATPKTVIKRTIEGLKAQIKVKGPNQKQAIRNLDAFQETLDDFGGKTLSQREVKDFIKALDDNIDWDKQSMKASNEALKKLRTGLDQQLKNKNPLYKEAMQPVEDMVGNLQQVKTALGLKKEVGEGLVPTDTTITKFQNLPKDRKIFSQEIIEKFDEHTGGDLLNQAKLSQVANATEGGVTSGSRNVLAGLSVDMVTTGIPGPTAAAGYIIDRYGRKLGKEALIRSQQLRNIVSGKMADGSLSKEIGEKISNNSSKLVNSKFGSIIENAIQRGNHSLGATHFMLLQTQPEYRELMENDEDE